ncbi:hypothetical protein CNEO4_720006 [Clostridium neonatale]|nr:hypothetical protein CNEO4_370032 [Clostridium neonatale]CAI3687104.1 hypothetical protein CNEO3_50041 [Clostridium neonatale]CAI3698104.1 hypothetical protein CNEO4_720006 [Clostridium neonatale]CAI3710207.1 hypothetical protein CNEO4_760006 [Clostridium neonatale]
MKNFSSLLFIKEYTIFVFKILYFLHNVVIDLSLYNNLEYKNSLLKIIRWLFLYTI